jgi:60 kDa SS-A/Ro ribonucleoprotein
MTSSDVQEVAHKMSNYAKNFGSSKATPQTQPIPGSNQVRNSAGGFSWQVTDEMLLDRFLILGTEGGSYYASERDMTYKIGDAVRRLIQSDGPAVVERAADISEAGRAPKNDPAILVLAACAVEGDQATKEAAYRAVNRVCRIGTHIFEFAKFMTEMKGGSAGWGGGLQRAIARWYNEKSDNDLGYQVIKYRGRHGWTHADMLQQAHVRPIDDSHDAIFAWVRAEKNAARAEFRKDDPDFVDPAETRYRYGIKGDEGSLPEIFDAHRRMQEATTAKQVVKVLAEHPSFPWEGIPTEMLGEASVWETLAPNLPITATIRNLGRMTASGAMTVGNSVTKAVVSKLGDEEVIRKGRLHPINVLSAMMTYKQGAGTRGKLTWDPITKVIDALDEAFYTSFGNVTSTGKRWVLGLDISGSMYGGFYGYGYGEGYVAGIPGLTPAIASGAMAMITARTESDHEMMAFTDRFEPIDISPRQRLDDVVEKMREMSRRMGRTDCSLPMTWAQKNDVEADVFVVYTDSETYAGNPHPAQALEQYRQATGIPAKLIVVGMVANEFTIADPNDPLMLDVIGFDTATPNLMSEFAMM